MGNEKSIMDACQGCKYMVHTASPFPNMNTATEDECIRPAVDGTLAALKGAEQAGAKRVVVTSSVAAIMVGEDPTKVHVNEEDWSVPNECRPYEKSKTLAEQAAWDY